MTIVRPRGRLDAAGAPPLERELRQHLAQGYAHLLVDLSDTSYISSNGLRVLLGALKAARKEGGTLKLCCLNPRLKEIFEMVGFDQVFEIYATEAEAERAFGARRQVDR
jgi:anti-sigma B factor antagonist